MHEMHLKDLYKYICINFLKNRDKYKIITHVF